MTAFLKFNGKYSRSEKAHALQEFWDEMMPVVVVVVESTFAHDSTKVNHITSAVIKERTNMAKELVDTMRRDFGWSKTRIRDNLAVALRTQLSGLVVDLDSLGRRGSWMPGT